MISTINTSQLHDLSDLSELDKAQIAQSVWNNIKELETPIIDLLDINKDNSDMQKKAVCFVNKESPFEVGTDANKQLQTLILLHLSKSAKLLDRNVTKNERNLSVNQLINKKVTEIANQKAHEDLHNRLSEENLRFLLGIYPHFKALEAAYKAANEASTNSTFKVALFTHA